MICQNPTTHQTRFTTMPTTTFEIDDDLRKKAKVYATNNKTTLGALLNEGLADLLRRKQPAPKTPTRRAAK